MRRRRDAAACLLGVSVICLLAAGCGGRKDMGRVSGTVTFQGRPVADAVLRFTPKDRSPGMARTDAAGRYPLNTLRKGDGGFAGVAVVTITPWVEPFIERADDAITGRKPPPEPPRPDIPAQFRTAATTPLTVEVVAGKRNVFDFELSTVEGSK
ncbi:MAG: hypothetical protein ACKOHK_13265 [Planctomycetia bacterium]